MYYRLLSFFFFFQSSGDHRHLHSFPTRRSSDLADGIKPVMAWSGGQAGSLAYLIASQGSGIISSRTDRKSTRLNSSHRCISYAVFCLKKKKKTKYKQQNHDITLMP